MFGFVHKANNLEKTICKHSNVPDSKVFGFDVPTLDFKNYPRPPDTIKERRFYFGFFFLYVNSKTYESGTISTGMNQSKV